MIGACCRWRALVLLLLVVTVLPVGEASSVGVPPVQPAVPPPVRLLPPVVAGVAAAVAAAVTPARAQFAQRDDLYRSIGVPVAGDLDHVIDSAFADV